MKHDKLRRAKLYYRYAHKARDLREKIAWLYFAQNATREALKLPARSESLSVKQRNKLKKRIEELRRKRRETRDV